MTIIVRKFVPSIVIAPRGLASVSHPQIVRFKTNKTKQKWREEREFEREKHTYII